MKWNVAIVFFFFLLLAGHYFLVDERFGSGDGQVKIRILPLTVSDVALKEAHPDIVASREGRRKTTGVHPVPVLMDGDVQVHVSLHNSKAFIGERDVFSPADKIYLSLVFPHLKAGQYHLATRWKTPQGNFARKVSRDIQLQHDVEKYGAYFWLQLVENNSFTQLFTGEEYKKKVYGAWEVLLYCNGRLIATKPFTVLDM